MSNEYKDWIKDKNYDLCQQYPFLIPKNRFSGNIVDNYDYLWTEMDSLPLGWHALFLQMCEDIKPVLVKNNYLNQFRFSQLKEKYGTMRCYDFGAPQEVHNIIHKYEYLSQFICIDCGSTDAQMYDDGWLSPFCPNCFRNKRKKRWELCGLPPQPEKTEKFVVGGKFSPTFTIETSLNGRTTTETVDVSDEWIRIKKREK